MASPDDIFYRPDIPPPEREPDKVPEEVRASRERQLNDRDAVAAEMGIPKEDLPENSFDLMKTRFNVLKAKAVELAKRARFLLDKTIEDIDGYIGDAPPIILKYIEDLTGRSFTHIVEEDGVQVRVPKPKTDEVYTLDDCTMKCIFKSAGYYDPSKNETDIAKTVDSGSQAVRQKVEEIRTSDYMNEVVYGLKLLILVLKMCFVLIVHYTVGYVCGWLKSNSGIRVGLDIISSFFGIPMLGTIVMNATKAIERALLSIVGFRCNSRSNDYVMCDNISGYQFNEEDFKTVNCCTMNSIFFGQQKGDIAFDLSKCFEYWIKQELDPAGSGLRSPCSIENCDDDNVSTTPEESAKAKEVTEYLMENPSRNNIMSSSNIMPLSRAIEASESGVLMSDQAQSALDRSRNYMYTGRREAPWDCFGYAMDDRDRESDLFGTINDAAARFKKTPNDVLISKSVFALEYLQMLDEAITAALEMADKAVIGVANLAKWGSSRQLCCYVYMIVIVSTMIQTLIEKGSVCPDMDFMAATREELRWARDLRQIPTVAKFLHILQVIKKIIDMFRNRMSRSMFLAGLKLPLREMWELIKITLANGIAQFLDILLGPIDQVLSGLTGVPEVRHMINNECFGVDKLFDFLRCLLGNLKWGIVNWIMQFLDFTMSDFTIIDDIFLCRTKLAFLDALSRLLDNMINLILGIRDCYDPSDLTNQIVDKQMTDQYYSTLGYMEVMKTPEAVRYADECSKSIMGQQFIPPENRQKELAALDGGLTKIMTESGLVDFPEKVMRDTLGLDGAVIDIQNFMDTSGDGEELKAVELGDFVKRMEELTGVRTTEIKESLRSIFSILRGDNNEAT